jgi:diguanylate cyclase (GGDEF)-like protein/PAS domain S-box-containing protein
VTEETRAAQIAPLFGRPLTLILGEAIGIVCAAITTLRLSRGWPDMLLCGMIAALLARLVLLRAVARERRQEGDAAMLRGLGWYAAVGIVWAGLGGIWGALCVIDAGDATVRMLAIIFVFSISGGLALRKSQAPRLATAQLCLLLLPMALAGPIGGGDGWLVSFGALTTLAGLVTMLRHAHADALARLHAEHENRALAARFEAAIGNMTQGLLLVDAGGRLQVVNRRFRELFAPLEAACTVGAKLADLAGLCHAFGLSGAWLDPTAPPATKPAATPPATEVRDLADGRAVAVSHERLADGGRVVTFEDVTQRRQAELALAEREAALAAIFNNAAAGVAELDAASGGFTRVNREFCRIVGRPEAALLEGMTLRDVVHPDDRHGLGDRLMGSLRRAGPPDLGAAADGEQRYLRPDGTVLWARASSAATSFDAAGRPLRIVWVLQDVTRHRAAEAALRQSHEFLDLAMRAAQIGHFRYDPIAGLVHCGPAARRLHCLPDGDGPVPAAEWFAPVPPEDLARLREARRINHASGSAEVHHEYRVIDPADGVAHHVEVRGRLIYGADGQVSETLGVVLDVTERHRVAARMAHLAHHDPLTGLANRALFQDRLGEAAARARRGEHFALCHVDLDRFKEVNDTLGHAAGDALLLAVARRLTGELRETDTLARLGSDEFAVIQVSLHQPHDASVLAQRLIACLGEPFAVAGQAITVSATIGVALAPADATEADQLLKNANLALHRAKLEGGGKLRFFEPEMDAQMRARRAIERDLRHAVEAGEFELFYQPLVDIPTRRVSGLEALLRWRHGERGLVGPNVFISLVEENGLIEPIGAWALMEACRRAAVLPEAPKVAVNLSVSQFPSRTLVDNVALALQQSGLDPTRLELEITESVLMTDSEATMATLRELKALGARIALDDFGTGYSSMSYLQRFPFDKVKIDRSFIAELGRRPESMSIVRAMLALCRALGMATTAEGVETQAQLDALEAEGCMEAQGYLFSHPRPAPELPRLIAAINAGSKEGWGAAPNPAKGMALGTHSIGAFRT